MSHTVCHDIGQWITDNVSEQVEKCVEQDCDWWCLCCNKWFCFLVWVLVQVTKWVVTTVCEVIADVVDLVINIIKGLVDIIVGLVTGDWTRFLAGFGEIVGGVVLFIVDIIPIVTGGTLVGTFVDGADQWSLRNYANKLLTDKYGNTDAEGLKKIQDAVGITSGGFSLRLDAKAQRVFLRSDFSMEKGGVPDLVTWAKAGKFDLKSLCGFNPMAWWSRTWPELVGDTGDISASDIDAYLAANGTGSGIKHFTLFSMSRGDLQTRLDCADAHSPEVALRFRWTIEDVRATDPSEVLINRNQFATVLPRPPFNRVSRAVDANGAQMDLSMPLVIGAFDFSDGTGLGISAHETSCTCLEADDTGSTDFPGEGITGSAIRYRKPDVMFKYTAIHELGHTFGLCHVNGLLRIMFTNAPGAEKSIWSWSSLWKYWSQGVEAGFILDEGKKVWDYIVANFSSAQLQARPF